VNTCAAAAATHVFTSSRVHAVTNSGERLLSSDPSVSVIVLNYNGREHLQACFGALLALDYPAGQLDLVLADNASTDDSLALMAREFPGVRVVRLDRNYGFSGGYNRAIADAPNELVVLLNNDTRVAPGFVRELVACWQRHQPVCAAVGAAMLTWDGRTVDFGGARLNFHAFALVSGRGQPYRPDSLGVERPIPFPCGGAMLIERRFYLDLGGLDEDYFAYFEDLDLGWRVWLCGREVWFAPASIVFHVEHGYWNKVPTIERMRRLELNALRTMVKNYEQSTLDRVLPAALELAVQRAALDSMGPVAALKPEGDAPARVEGVALAPLLAVQSLPAVWPALQARRAQVQQMRRRSDAELIALFGDGWLAPARVEPAYVTAHRRVVAAHGLEALVNPGGNTIATVGARTRLLIICHDTVGPNMSGPALRHWELARVLARHLDVTLAAPGEPAREPEGFRLAGYRRADSASLAALLAETDVIFTYARVLLELPFLATAGRPLALDLATPYMLEALEQHAARPPDEQQREQDELVRALRGQLAAGDFFVCASERQRLFWLGALSSAGRINPATFDDDLSLRALIDVVPFGVPSEPPRHRRRVLKGVHPAIGEHDRLILWGSGIWDWFDPLTLLRALARVVAVRPEVKLFFAARSHFDPSVVPEHAMAARAVELARELGLLDTHVFFGDWVPYDERENYLLEADLGASLHFDHVETRFAVRTRLLDYFWAGLPMVVTRGDVLSEVVDREGLGRVVAAGDVDGLAAAILELLDTQDLRARLAPAFDRVRAQYAWQRAAEPLLAFCRAPHPAADAGTRLAGEPAGLVAVPPPWWRLPLRAIEYLRAGGVRYVWQGLRLYGRWIRESARRRGP